MAPVRIISTSTLTGYRHARGAVLRAIEDWHHVAAHATWTTPHAIKATFGNASIIDQDRVVFNLCGNKHRIVARIDYRWNMLFILWIGTHAEYDLIDAASITYRKDTP